MVDVIYLPRLRERLHAAMAGGRARTFLFACGIACFAFGSRLWLIARYGSAVPFWDVWDAEADLLFRPLLHGTFPWSALFAAHNEHRILFTRLEALLLYALNRQWDPLLEMTFTAGLVAVTAATLFVILSSVTNRSREAVIAAALAILFALPYGPENTLVAFNSQYWFLEFFALVSIWLLLDSRPFSTWWWVAFGCGIAGCFTLGSGFFSGAAILAGVGLRAIRERRPTAARAALPTIGAALGIVVLGVATRRIIPGHDDLAAHSIKDFVSTFSSCLAWPFFQDRWCAIPLWLPALLLLVQVLRRTDDQAASVTLLGCCAWVVLQSAAVAFARSNHGSPPVARYVDMLALSIPLNLCALLLLEASPFPSPRLRALLTAVWVCFVCVGLMRATSDTFAADLPFREHLSSVESENLQQYLVTHDLAALQSKAKYDIPYPSADRLASLLDDEKLRGILPADFQPPIAIESARPTCFVPGGTWRGFPTDVQKPSWGSYGGRGDADQCEFESNWFVPSTSFLMFELAGFLGDGRLRLTIQGQTSSTVVHSRLMVNGWEKVVTSVPAGPIRIFAQDGDPLKWFAFRNFHALGWLSYYAAWLRARSKYVLLAGVLCFLLALQWHLVTNDDDHRAVASSDTLTSS